MGVFVLEVKKLRECVFRTCLFALYLLPKIQIVIIILNLLLLD